MVLVSIHVMPHGAMILDLSLSELPVNTELLHHACAENSVLLKQSECDVLILCTPHGISLGKSIGLYANEELKGSAAWKDLWSDFTCEALVDMESTTDLLNLFHKNDINADTITCFSQGCCGNLAWGEVVPLWFCKDTLSTKNTVGHSMKLIVMSWSRQRLQCRDYINEGIRCGQVLQEFASAHPKRVSIMMSCDLAHTHPTPLGTPDIFCSSYPVNSDISSTFDRYIVDWAKALLEDHDVDIAHDLLLNQASVIADEALVCLSQRREY